MPFPAPHPAQITVLDTVRPLAVGMVFTDQFEIEAPAHWTDATVVANLFKLYPMETEGWSGPSLDIDSLGIHDDIRRWRITRLP
jgi:hypothetical protein